MPSDRKTIVETYQNFLDGHRDVLQVARKGYLDTLQKLFKEECGIEKEKGWIMRQLKIFRNERDCPLHYRDDKYYTSERKRAYQSKALQQPSA